jgi:Ni/Co efflux regulator RcnB
MQKILLISAACFAVLTLSAQAEENRDHGHGRATGAQMEAPRGQAVRTNKGHGGNGRSWNANDVSHHREGGRMWRAADTPADNNATRGHNEGNNATRGREPHDNGMRGREPRNNAMRGRSDVNGGVQGTNGRWQGNRANTGWQGNRTGSNAAWRNNRATWSHYHRSWTANRRYHWNRAYVRPAGWHYQRWTLGAVLPALFFAQQYWIGDYAIFALDPPPPGTVWVRYGSDALLVDRYNGEIIQVVYGIFY